MSRKKRKRSPREPDLAAALASLAAALNRCERAGLHPDLRHGIAITEAGYVLPIKDKWAARPLKKYR